MKTKKAKNEFYPDRFWAAVGILGCGVMAAIGLVMVCLADIGGLWPGLAFLGLGALGFDPFLSLLRMRVVVGPDGMAKRTRSWLGGFEIRWAEVEGWSVELSDSEENPGMRILRLRTRRGVLQVSEANVSVPGFEPFLAAVRRHIGGRESPE